MWHIVRNRGCCGEKLRREYAIGPYLVDFCCVTLKLTVEMDGAHHFTEEGKRRDARRDQYLREEGDVALRILGYDLLRDSLSVRERDWNERLTHGEIYDSFHTLSQEDDLS